MTGKAYRPEQARPVAEAFAQHGVESRFIGKGGAILLGYPGATQDVDVFSRRSQTHGRRSVAGLLELGFSLTPADNGDKKGDHYHADTDHPPDEAGLVTSD